MKKTLLMILAMLLMAAPALAVSVQLTDGSITVDALTYDDGTGTELALDSFQLLGRGSDGGYLVYNGECLYWVQDIAMERTAEFVGEIPALGTLETLARGMRGDEVVPLQQALETLGYLSGAADGDFGAGTEAAVRAFQTAKGLEPTGQADEVTRLLAESMAGKTVTMEGASSLEIMFAPLIGRTDVDIQPIMDSGLRLNYDDITGMGFISDGTVAQYDASGATDLDKYELTYCFGLLTRDNGGVVEIVPAMKVRCLCVRRPVLSEVTVKSGTARGTAQVEDLQVSLDGVYTVEEGIVVLSDAMADALVQAPEAGELKMRIGGEYQSFDVEVADWASAAKVGELAKVIGK